MKKKLLFATALTVLMATQFTAGAKTTISFWYSHGGDSGKGVQECLKEFMKQHPDIVVKPTIVGWDQIQSKLAVAVSAGAAPDCAIFDRFWIGRWTNLLVPLDKYINRDGIKKAEYFKAAWDEDSYEGHVFGIPMEASTGALFYNKNIFKQAGMAGPPQTYDELLTQAVKLLKRDPATGNLTQLGYSPTIGWSFFYTYLYAAGGQLLSPGNKKATLNTPEGLAAANWILKSIDLSGGLSKVNTIFKNGDPFTSGRLAMEIGGSWMVKDLKKTAPGVYQSLDITLPPSFGGKPRSMMVGGFAAVIPKGSKKENAAWELVKFLGGREGQRIYCTNSWQTPSLKKVFNEPYFQDNSNLKVYADVMEECGWYRPITPVNSQMWDIVNGEMWNMLLNRKKGPAECLDWAEKQINGHLARYSKKR